MQTADLFLDPRDLIQHERVQQQRLRTVAAQVARDGIRVPVAVAAVERDRFFVVDGAHRSAAAALLGMSRVPCTVVQVGGEPEIDGWTHVIHGVRLAAVAGLDDAPADGTGPVVATLRLFGRTWPVRASDSSAVEVHRAFHRVGATYQHLRYDRAQRPVPAAWCQVTWRIPGWEQLVELVLRHGPLPAGITRFDVERRLQQVPLAA